MVTHRPRLVATVVSACLLGGCSWVGVQRPDLAAPQTPCTASRALPWLDVGLAAGSLGAAIAGAARYRPGSSLDGEPVLNLLGMIFGGAGAVTYGLSAISGFRAVNACEEHQRLFARNAAARVGTGGGQGASASTRAGSPPNLARVARVVNAVLDRPAPEVPALLRAELAQAPLSLDEGNLIIAGLQDHSNFRLYGSLLNLVPGVGSLYQRDYYVAVPLLAVSTSAVFILAAQPRWEQSTKDALGWVLGAVVLGAVVRPLFLEDPRVTAARAAVGAQPSALRPEGVEPFVTTFLSPRPSLAPGLGMRFRF